MSLILYNRDKHKLYNKRAEIKRGFTMTTECLKTCTLEVLNEAYYTLFEYRLTKYSHHSEMFLDADDIATNFAHATNLRTVWVKLHMFFCCLYYMNGVEVADTVLNDNKIASRLDELKTNYGLDFSKKIDRIRNDQIKHEAYKDDESL